MYPDYGTPGNPSMDPYYISPEQEREATERDREQQEALREAIAFTLADYRADIYLADIRQIVVEELNKLRHGAGEPVWQTAKPVVLPIS